LTPKLTDVGPLRHPKPLTPSDLHLVLEKEQEAMVRYFLFCMGRDRAKLTAPTIGQPVDPRALPPSSTVCIRHINNILYLKLHRARRATCIPVLGQLNRLPRLPTTAIFVQSQFSYPRSPGRPSRQRDGDCPVSRHQPSVAINRPFFPSNGP
jgi:hypothetical protein